jgi:hypothetical protein
MRYRVNWLKDGKAHHLLIRETTPGEALSFAWALLVEVRPSDIWIETEGGRQVANYEDIVQEGPIFAGPPPPLNRHPESQPRRRLEAAAAINNFRD